MHRSNIGLIRPNHQRSHPRGGSGDKASLSPFPPSFFLPFSLISQSMMAIILRQVAYAHLAPPSGSSDMVFFMFLRVWGID